MDPWSKGNYSRHIWEALMVVEKLPEVNPPSGRVPGRVILALLFLQARRRRNRGENRDAGKLPRVFGTGCKYRPKEGTRGGGPRPGALLVRPGVGPQHLATWVGPCPPSGPTSGFWSLLMR